MIVSAEEFVALRTSERSEDYLRAAHDDASKEVWLDVIARFPEMRVWVAHNKSLPLEILEVLATDDDARVRASVASKNKLSIAMFAELSRDADAVVRIGIARNKNAPVEILRELSFDPSELVSSASLERLALLG